MNFLHDRKCVRKEKYNINVLERCFQLELSLLAFIQERYLSTNNIVAFENLF